jgi:cytosine/adenosine deaminase-related metal-dependent hydrolase
MLNSSVPGVTLLNASPWGEDRVTSVRVTGAVITAVGQSPQPGDRIIDLQGDRLLPGLINAHDHLTLNTLPPLPGSTRYQHVREWIVDANTRRRTDRQFEACAQLARDQRLFFGGLKNLLSGVTTVAHHDPLYPGLLQDDFPTRVLPHYGWSHSLYLDGAEAVQECFRRTPRDFPWIIHAGEGIDAEAAAEFTRLDELGCVQPNTLLVHGIAFDAAQRARLLECGAGLIWCPASNLRLFGRTASLGELASAGRVALGTDSRLSGSRDLLAELQVARANCSLPERELERLVTDGAARLLRRSDCGALQVGRRADLLVLPRGLSLVAAERSQIRLVVSGGVARLAHPDYAAQMASPLHWASIDLDGSHRMLHRPLAAILAAAAITEPGLKVVDTRWRAA